jgi:AraC-like DNA-binding protein
MTELLSAIMRTVRKNDRIQLTGLRPGYTAGVAELIGIRDYVDGLNGIGLGVQLFPCYRNTGRWPHSHDAVELTFLVAGRAEHVLGDRILPMRPGSLGITHHTQVHDLRTDEAGIEVINCYIDLARCPLPSLGAGLDRELMRLLPLQPSLAHRRHHFLQVDVPDGSAERILRSMLDEQAQRRPGWHDALRCWLGSLLLVALRAAQADDRLPERSSQRASDERMQEVAQMIEERLDEPFDLPALAEEVGMARSSLCRAFKRSFACSPGDYLRRCRIERAQRLLLEADEPIVAVAAAVGYDDASLFGRHFRQQVGMSPSSWRAADGT